MKPSPRADRRGLAARFGQARDSVTSQALSQGWVVVTAVQASTHWPVHGNRTAAITTSAHHLKHPGILRSRPSNQRIRPLNEIRSTYTSYRSFTAVEHGLCPTLHGRTTCLFGSTRSDAAQPARIRRIIALPISPSAYPHLLILGPLQRPFLRPLLILCKAFRGSLDH